MIELKSGEFALNQIPREYLKIGDKVTSLVTGNPGKITNFGPQYITIHFKKSDGSISRSAQEHGVYSMVRYDEEYEGPAVTIPYD